MFTKKYGDIFFCPHGNLYHMSVMNIHISYIFRKGTYIC